MSSAGDERPTNKLPGILRLDTLDVHGVFAEESGLLFVPVDPVDYEWHRLSGQRGVVSWTGFGCRFEIDVQVQTPPGGTPLRLIEESEVLRIQERRSIRVAARLPSEVWLNSNSSVSRLTGETINISATGVAIAVDRGTRESPTPLPRAGDLVAITIDLDDRRLPLTAEVIAVDSSLRAAVCRLRFLAARVADADRVAGFVIRSNARRQ